MARKSKKSRFSSKKKWWCYKLYVRRVLFWSTTTALAGLLFAAMSLPNINNLEKASYRKAEVRIVAVDGSPIFQFGNRHGKPVLLRNLPITVPNALLATEDRRFYKHLGIDLIGILRALGRNINAGRILQGGSTITQQLAKNLFLTQERTLSRKIRETLLAFWLEYRLTKDEILTIYLNRAYFGAGLYGVDAAARHYFGKSSSKLGLYESAVLVGLLKAPSHYNPIVYPKRAAERANQILRNMVAVGWLSEQVAHSQFRQSVATVNKRVARNGARYFADWVLRQAEGFLGGIDNDVIIHTTLDPKLQRAAEKYTSAVMSFAKEKRAGQVAVLTLSPNGAIRLMVGGSNYDFSQFNRATQARRQPGSAFKLFIYLAAVESGIGPDQRVKDMPIAVQGWKPRNHNRRHLGPITLREGVARSSNAIAVALAEKIGRDKVVQVARRLGVSSKLGSKPSLALGVYEIRLSELVASYATFANAGRAVEPFGIEKISTLDGRILYSRSSSISTKVVADRDVIVMNDLLYAALNWGTGKAARIRPPAAGKTGTTQGYRDAWFIGYTGHYVTGVWMGNDNSQPTKGLTGGSLPAQLWKTIMEDAHQDLPYRRLPGVNAKD